MKDSFVLELQNYNNIYIYGSGFYGTQLAAYFIWNTQLPLRAIIVSSGWKERDVYYTGDGHEVPIYEYEEFVRINNYNENAICINTVVTKNKNDISAMIKSHNIKVLEITDELVNEIRMELFENYLDIQNAHLSDEVLHIGNVKVYNPILESIEFRNSFFDTLGDEIISMVFKDNSFTVEGPYEYNNVCIYDNDIVIDAGANIGLFSCYAASKGGVVYSFEPDKRAICLLKKQKELYPNNIIIINKGLYEYNGKIGFCEGIDSTSSHIGTDIINEKDEISIDITSIDDMVDCGEIPRVDFIKADIEGAERNMLKGASKTLKQFAPKLSICTYHYSDDCKVLESIIKEANPKYIVEHHWRKLYAYVPQ